MFTWISKAVLFPLLVSGCVAPDIAAGLLPNGGQSGPEQRQSLTVSGVKLAGPSGFCPLPGTQQQVSGAGFVVFAPCDGSEGIILTATIGAEGSAAGITLTQASMEPYFRTPQGILALRGAGNRDGIAVHEVREFQGAVILRLTRETSEGRADSWRAVMQLEGRLVTLSVRARQGQSLGFAAGQTRIRQFVTALQVANRL